MASSFYRILLVEDEPSMSQTIWEMLKDSQDCKFQMVRAESVQAGLPKLASEIDALLLNIDGPEGSGLASVPKIHAQFSSLPIIVLIRQGTETLGKQALAAGAAEYLVKETLSPALLQRVLQYARERQRDGCVMNEETQTRNQIKK
jgi:DNA-binding response OmpR family regulator